MEVGMFLDATDLEDMAPMDRVRVLGDQFNMPGTITVDKVRFVAHIANIEEKKAVLRVLLGYTFTRLLSGNAKHFLYYQQAMVTPSATLPYRHG